MNTADQPVPCVEYTTARELITRDELLKRVRNLGVQVHPRTLQSIEKLGLCPRPIRRWHKGAVRALYASWAVDIVVRAQYHSRNHTPLELAKADMRDLVMNTSSHHADSAVSLFDALRTIARYYGHLNDGTDIEKMRITYVMSDGNEVTHRYVFPEKGLGQKPLTDDKDEAAA